MTQSLGSLLSKLAVVGRFGPNLAQFGPSKNLSGLASCQGCSGGAHDSQKHVQTQNQESLKSKIAEIFLLYFCPSKSARSLKQLGKVALKFASDLKITYTWPPEQSVLVECFFTVSDKRWKHLNLLWGLQNYETHCMYISALHMAQLQILQANSTVSYIKARSTPPF